MVSKEWKVDRRNVSWEKKSRKEGYDSRGNVHAHLRIYVFNSPHGWVLRDTSTFTNPEISRYFKTKKQALKFAHAYIRTH